MHSHGGPWEREKPSLSHHEEHEAHEDPPHFSRPFQRKDAEKRRDARTPRRAYVFLTTKDTKATKGRLWGISEDVGEGLVPSRREPTRGSPTTAGKMPALPEIEIASLRSQ